MSSLRAVVQRVDWARVKVGDRELAAIDRGFLVLLGVARDDSEEDAVYLATKVAGLRVFEDEEGRFNFSITDVGGKVLVVSQFTLLGDCRKGRRPSFTEAAPPDKGEELYLKFVDHLRMSGLTVSTGKFGARMVVELANSGPVTILLDSKRLF